MSGAKCLQNFTEERKKLLHFSADDAQDNPQRKRPDDDNESSKLT